MLKTEMKFVGACVLALGLAGCTQMQSDTMSSGETMTSADASAATLDILPGPGEVGSCENRNADTVVQPASSLTQYRWCPSTRAGYAQRDRYARTVNGMPWMYTDPNYLFGCKSEQYFILSSIGANGYAIVCPAG